MMMEEIRAAAELERQLAEQYAAAQAEAKKRITLEQRAGERHLEDSRRNEEVDARHRMEDAERRAAAQTDAVLSKAREACEAFKQRARAQMDETAEWIAEKVVEEQWQS